MDGIRAAFVSRADLERIRISNPDLVSKIERIGQLLIEGKETEEDMAVLCKLLFEIGDTAKAELMLVANSTEGDRLHALHQCLFGAVEENYNRSIRDFAEQFGVSMTLLQSLRLYSQEFLCVDCASSNEAGHPILRLFPSSFEARITYEPGFGIIADTYAASESNHPLDVSNRALSFRYKEGMWTSPDTNLRCRGGKGDGGEWGQKRGRSE
jgi:hypothetical protein